MATILAAEQPDERLLTVDLNSREDSEKLSNNQFQLHIAKGVVVKNGDLIYNIVWKSSSILPVTTIKWKPVYGFNWTSDALGDGISVALGGQWMECEIGQALDINEQGWFVRSTAKGTPGFISIGKNSCKTPDTNGLHVSIGLKNAAGDFDIIFVDPIVTGLNMSASFQPQEKIQWWYEAGSKQGTMFYSHSTTYEEGDFSKKDEVVGSFKKSSKYVFDEGKWYTKAIK